MIALDTSAIICLVEHYSPANDEVAAWVLQDEDRILASTLAIAEALTGPLRSGDRELYWRYHAFFAMPEVEVREVTSAVAEQAAALRARFQLKTVDALHLATAIERRGSTFVTADQKDFARCAGHVNLQIVTVQRAAGSN